MCTWADLRDWVYSWDDIWTMIDMQNLQSWLEWKHHEAADAARNR